MRLATNTRRRDWLHVLPSYSHRMLPSVPSPAELTVIKVTLADGTIVFHIMCSILCLIAKPCQDQALHTLQILTQMVGRMLSSRCRWRFSLARHGASGAFRNGGAKTAPLLELFPLGAATTVTPAWTGPWLRLDLGPARYREC